MEGLRIIELPACKMVTSGPGSLEDFEDFNTWFSQTDKLRTDRFYPRDFMWYDSENQTMTWYYALPDGVSDTGGFEVVDYEGGLYAAAISRDLDDGDGERVYALIKQWVDASGCFELDERPDHYTMFHITTSDMAFEALGYRQLDIYVPIKVKNK